MLSGGEKRDFIVKETPESGAGEPGYVYCKPWLSNKLMPLVCSVGVNIKVSIFILLLLKESSVYSVYCRMFGSNPGGDNPSMSLKYGKQKCLHVEPGCF